MLKLYTISDFSFFVTNKDSIFQRHTFATLISPACIIDSGFKGWKCLTQHVTQSHFQKNIYI